MFLDNDVFARECVCVCVCVFKNIFEKYIRHLRYTNMCIIYMYDGT